jgi:hypothetical protein
MILEKVRVGTSDRLKVHGSCHRATTGVDICAGYMQGASDLGGLERQLLWGRDRLRDGRHEGVMRSGRRFINPLDLNVQRVPKRNPIPLAESEV